MQRCKQNLAEEIEEPKCEEGLLLPCALDLALAPKLDRPIGRVAWPPMPQAVGHVA